MSDAPHDEVRDELAALAAAIARAEPASDEDREQLVQLGQRLTLLIQMLIGRGVLRPNDARILELFGQSSARPRVRLAMVRDKHAIAGPAIDCAAHLHLCHARCCTFRVTLSEAEVRDGGLRWDLEEPYLLARQGDGYCTHLRGDGGGCECYGDRPATCREYDCREDRRVWLDYEARIPAPMPDGVEPRF